MTVRVRPVRRSAVRVTHRFLYDTGRDAPKRRNTPGTNADRVRFAHPHVGRSGGAAVTVVAVDDTDSRGGACTTHLAARLADRLVADHEVSRRLLVRCNPAVPAKTRGNAACAVHTAAPPDRALAAASDVVERGAETADGTSPGVVVAPGDPADVPRGVVAHARAAVTDHLALADALAVADAAGYAHEGWA